MKYRDNMTPAEQATLLAEFNLDEQCYAEAFAYSWLDELSIAIWLAAQWEQAGKEAGVPRDEWDTEQHRRYFIEDIDSFDPVRDGWVGKDGRP
jgi:hypothetical protein